MFELPLKNGTCAESYVNENESELVIQLLEHNMCVLCLHCILRRAPFSRSYRADRAAQVSAKFGVCEFLIEFQDNIGWRVTEKLRVPETQLDAKYRA